MIHSQLKPPLPSVPNQANGEVIKKKKRKNKKKKNVQVTEDSSDSDSDDDGFAFLRSQNTGIAKSQPKPKAKPSVGLVSQTNQLGKILSLTLSLSLSSTLVPLRRPCDCHYQASHE
jgi:hypothetical protein